MPRGPLVVINTLILLLLAEGAARLVERIRPPSGEISFSYSPYRMLKMSRAPWPLNKDGFRAQELDTYHDSFLVEFLGGSVCLGVGDHPAEPIPDRLEDALHRAGMARARVLNLCQGGVTSAQEVEILIEYGLPLHPQAVLSFDGANDVLHPRPIGEDETANLPYQNAQLEARVDGRDALSHLALVRVALRLAGRVRGRASDRLTRAAGEPVPLEQILDSYLYHLDLARALATGQSAFYAVLLQPSLHLDKPWSAEESAMWRRIRPRDAAPLGSVIHMRYALAREQASHWAESSGAHFYDLTRVFADHPETLYSDSVHFRGALGYEMLFAALERQGLIDRLRARYQAWETGL